MDKLHVMAETLIKYETITTEQISDVMEGKTPREPKDWSDSGSSQNNKRRPQQSDDTLAHRAHDNPPLGSQG